MVSPRGTVPLMLDLNRYNEKNDGAFSLVNRLLLLSWDLLPRLIPRWCQWGQKDGGASVEGRKAAPSWMEG
jgi:hypothetical protein